MVNIEHKKCYNKTTILKVNKSKHVKTSWLYLIINPFSPNVQILYPLKTSDIFRGYNMGRWRKNGLKTLHLVRIKEIVLKRDERTFKQENV